MIWKLLYRMARRENRRLRNRNAELQDRVKALRSILRNDPRLTMRVVKAQHQR